MTERDVDAQAASLPIVRVDVATGALQATDDVAVEEPLELQVQGASIAVVMRTPGHDLELALGFLVTEGVVARAADVRSIRHCTTAPSLDAFENVVQVQLADGVDVDLERLRRNLYASSSCGVCGKASLENVLVRCAVVDAAVRVPATTLAALPERLRAAQATFAATGGLHAAGLFDAVGARLVVREDVGRHNAVDKVVGWLVGAGRDPSTVILLVSGRLSFEVVQKAAVARIPIVAGISAPTSLAVSLANEAGLTLVGFLRGPTMNVYAGAQRIV